MNQETTLTGQVVKKLVSKDSKSEREAVVLVTVDKEYILRQHGGNPYSDPVLDEMVGKKMRGEGKILGHVFVISDYEVLD
jgi:hypothetical protein